MPYVGFDFGDADPGDQDFYGFNFKPRLNLGETLTGAGNWSISAIIGFDPTPSNRLIGQPALIGLGTQVVQTIGGMIGGVKYLVQVIVFTSLGRKLVEFSHINCKAPS